MHGHAGAFDAALAHHDTSVWAVEKPNLQVQMGSLDLLLRLHAYRAVHTLVSDATATMDTGAAASGGASVPPSLPVVGDDVRRRLQDVVTEAASRMDQPASSRDPLYDVLVRIRSHLCTCVCVCWRPHTE